MIVRRVISALFDENSYLAYEEETNKGVFIDPGLHTEILAEMAEKEGVEPISILLTHGHIDHISGIPFLRKKYGIPVWLSSKEHPVLERALSDYGEQLHLHPADFEPDCTFSEGDRITDLQFRVMETPGHSIGSAVFEKENVLFTGDTLFPGSIGRTDLFTGNWNQMEQSLKRLIALDHDVLIYSGHGEETWLALEKRRNPFLLELQRS